MKKIGIIVVISLFLIGCSNEKLSYPVGKDSFIVVGDGKYQIIYCMQEYYLRNVETDDILLNYVKEYYDDGKRFFVSNGATYVIVDYEEDKVKKYFFYEQDEMDAKI